VENHGKMVGNGGIHGKNSRKWWNLRLIKVDIIVEKVEETPH